MEKAGKPRRALFLAVEGELDVYKARKVEAEIMRRWAPGSQVVVDLRKVSSFNLIGMVVLMQELDKMQDLVSAVSIQGLRGRIRQLLEERRLPVAEWICISGSETEGIRLRR